MDIVFLLIAGFVLFSVLITTVNMGNTRPRCDERGVRHIWTYETHNGERYMICADCKYIPNIVTEQKNRSDDD